VPTRFLIGLLGLPNGSSKSFNRDCRAAGGLLDSSQSAADGNGCVLRNVGISHT
jgi:hypothetical protein